jgi:hypothetical protein
VLPRLPGPGPAPRPLPSTTICPPAPPLGRSPPPPFARRPRPTAAALHHLLVHGLHDEAHHNLIADEGAALHRLLGLRSRGRRVGKHGGAASLGQLQGAPGAAGRRPLCCSRCRLEAQQQAARRAAAAAAGANGASAAATAAGAAAAAPATAATAACSCCRPWRRLPQRPAHLHAEGGAGGDSCTQHVACAGCVVQRARRPPAVTSGSLWPGPPLHKAASTGAALKGRRSQAGHRARCALVHPHCFACDSAAWRLRRSRCPPRLCPAPTGRQVAQAVLLLDGRRLRALAAAGRACAARADGRDLSARGAALGCPMLLVPAPPCAPQNPASCAFRTLARHPLRLLCIRRLLRPRMPPRSYNPPTSTMF